MRCANPLVMYVNGDPHSFGCGHCLACKIQRSREWSFRLSVEASYWKDASFLTLTYNDENLPPDGSLVKADLQKFFKRLRKDLANPIKYYACGEYGDRFKRPHY